MTGPTQILLVEDSPGDVRLVQEAFKMGKLHHELTVARDGVEASELLEKGLEADALPDIVLLDLNLPRKDGRELLAEIKSHEALRRIPVVVLTTSDDDADVLRSYDLHCNSYITKPVDLPKFVDVVRHLENYWVQIVRLPRGGGI